ncbi:MAG: hypothetical protein AB7J63_01030 [Vicinamibacterales bacterium]
MDAFGLERVSAGGLLTLDSKGLAALQKLKLRGNHNRVRAGLERWQASLGNQDETRVGRTFCLRRDVVDVPWLLLRPLQPEDGALWAAENADADLALNAFLRVWNIAKRGAYAPQESGMPLDALKHHEAAERFAVQCHQMSHGGTGPRYQDSSELIARLGDLSTRLDP